MAGTQDILVSVKRKTFAFVKVCLFFGVQYVFAMQINSLKLYLNKETLTVTPEVQAHQDTYQ